MSHEYTIKFKDGYTQEQLTKQLSIVSKWEDARVEDVKVYKDTSTYDLVKYYEWKNDVKEYLISLPLVYKEVGTTAHFKDLIELYAVQDNDDYVFDAIMNYKTDGPIDDTIDTFNLNNVTDITLFGKISTKLGGNKLSTWKSAESRDTTRLSAALHEMKKTYLGEEESIKNMHKIKLKELKWDDKTTIATF